MIKLFIDASVFFSACYSLTGASYEILSQGTRGNVRLVISDFVLHVVARNLARKAPEKLGRFDEFWKNVEFELAVPTREEVLAAAEYTELKDAPIVAAARTAGVDYLVSLDRRHLVNRPGVAQASGLNIVLPEVVVVEIRRVVGE